VKIRKKTDASHQDLRTFLIEMTNNMQLCRAIYYSIVPWLLNMFRAML